MFESKLIGNIFKNDLVGFDDYNRAWNRFPGRIAYAARYSGKHTSVAAIVHTTAFLPAIISSYRYPAPS